MRLSYVRSRAVKRTVADQWDEPYQEACNRRYSCRMIMPSDGCGPSGNTHNRVLWPLGCGDTFTSQATLNPPIPAR